MADWPAIVPVPIRIVKLWVVIYAIGAAQALLLALALWQRPANRTANRMLAVWLAIVAADLAVKALYLAGFAPVSRAYLFVALFPFLYGSLFYLYVRALTTGRGFGGRDLIHLAGFALMLALVFPRLLLEPAALSARLAAGDLSPPVWWYDLALFGYSLSYVLAALVRLQRYRRRLRQRRSDADRMSLRWIGAMAISQLVIWCIAATQWLIQIPGVGYFLIYGAVAAWVCVVGWFSLGQPPVTDEASPPDAEAAPEDASDDDPRFPAVEARLSQLMAREALYREPALTIGQVAKRSGYPEYLVSAVINRRFGGNFWDYINRQRVEAVRACLAERDDTRTILEIAYASGFTSKSTFNAAFKRQLGQTPSDCRRQHADGAETEPASR